MADYVLLHGGNMSTDTWNRLAGREDYPPGGHLAAHYWDGTAAFLREHGHRVFAPTLADEDTSTLTEHVQQVRTLIADSGLARVVLMGHSYGGMVITGVAAGTSDEIRRIDYIDAALPDPGQSLYDLLKMGLAGSAGPNPVLPDPSPPYVEELRFDPAVLESLPKTYIFCTRSEFAAVTRLAKEKIEASPEGWTYVELPCSHVPMAGMPEKLNAMLLEAAAPG
jgi:pimeloyl-ACP methyl ester carboxylesterase